MDFIKKYWSENEFYYSDGVTPYNGYVGIYKNEGYIFDTEEKLVKKDSWATQINTSKYYFDRILDEEMELPYNRKQISLQANDFLIKGTIKTILQRLQANNDYIFKNALISDTLIPAIDDCAIWATKDKSRYYFVGASGATYEKVTNVVIDAEKNITVYDDIKLNYKDNENYSSNMEPGEGGPTIKVGELTLDYSNRNDNLSFRLEIGDQPVADFGNYKSVPRVKYKIDLVYGELACYSLASKKRTRTALDPTFYPVSVIKYKFKGASGKEYDYVSNNSVKNDIIAGYVPNKSYIESLTLGSGGPMVTNSEGLEQNYDKRTVEGSTDFQLQLYDKAYSNYGNYERIPNTMFTVETQEPRHNFHEITDSSIIVSSLEGEGENRYANVIIFLLFKTKLMAFKTKYYLGNFNNNITGLDTIDFKVVNNGNENLESHQVIEIDKADIANKNSLKFMDLCSMHINKNNLFLVDKTLNMILRYDISWLLGSDIDENMFDPRNFRLLDNVQGDGGPDSHIYFNKPLSIVSDDEYIYIADNGNNCIKVYTASFDYVRTLRNSSLYNHDIQALAICPYNMTLEDGTVLPAHSLWSFSTNQTALYVTVIDRQGINILYHSPIAKIRLLKDRYTWEEKFKSVEFSQNNSNYFYVSTTKRVYKIHLSKPNYPFASLSYFKQRQAMSTMIWGQKGDPWHALPVGNTGSSEYEDEMEGEEVAITWGYRPQTTSAEILDNKALALTTRDDLENQFNGDLVFHVGTLYDQYAVDNWIANHQASGLQFNDIPPSELSAMIKCSGLFLYNEHTSYISSVATKDIPCFLIDDIEDINSNEYVNPVTFNKCVYKVIYNLVNLRNILIGHFQGGYNLDNLMVYDQLVYDDFFQSFTIDNNQDYFIHTNEPTSIILNRIFENIYEVQRKFLEHMQATYVASPNLCNSSFRII